MTEVVAALIWDEGRFLICQRPADKTRGLLWEFAGGKVEPGETRQQALIRECREELAITVSVKDIFMEVTHQYPDMAVHLTCSTRRLSQARHNCLSIMLFVGSLPLKFPSTISACRPSDFAAASGAVWPAVMIPAPKLSTILKWLWDTLIP